MMEVLVSNVEAWAKQRGLLDNPNTARQMLKLTEEVGELAAAIARDDEAAVKDAIGDATVVLIILSAQVGLSFEGCLYSVYKEISQRTGKTVDGVFIKDNE